MVQPGNGTKVVAVVVEPLQMVLQIITLLVVAEQVFTGKGLTEVAGDYTGSPNGENGFCGKGGSPNFNTGLRGYSVDQPVSEWAGTDLGNGYDRNAQANAYGQGGQSTPDGGFPGGGGGGGNSGSPCGHGAHGMVRIMYGTISGNTRSFPSTYASRTDQYASGVTETVYGTQKMY